jgi:hypothetical protein
VAEDDRETRTDLRRSNALQVETLKPAEHGGSGLGDLLRLRRREDEHDARRRLLEHLEQRVPRLARQHVRFVDDVDLVAVVARRRVHRALAKIARVVDAAIGCRIDLDDIEARGPAPDARAGAALAARLAFVARLPPLAVERHRQHPGEGRLADATRPAQQVPVRDAPARDRALQRAGDMRLHRDLVEPLGTIFPGESQHRRGERTVLR